MLCLLTRNLKVFCPIIIVLITFLNKKILINYNYTVNAIFFKYKISLTKDILKVTKLTLVPTGHTSVDKNLP